MKRQYIEPAIFVEQIDSEFDILAGSPQPQPKPEVQYYIGDEDDANPLKGTIDAVEDNGTSDDTYGTF